MTSNFLVDEKILVIPKEILVSESTLASIDRGCSLTKVLYATEKDSEHYNLHFALFKNAHFEEGLKFLGGKDILNKDNGKIRVTGAGCYKYKDAIKQHLGLEIDFMDEMLSQTKGCAWLVNNFKSSDICYPDVEVEPVEEGEKSETFKKFAEILSLNTRKSGDIYPAAFCFIGSGGGAFIINEDGSTEMLGGVSFAGKSFLGMAKLLLDTSDYDEIMSLASKGSRNNTDTQVKDVLRDEPDSPYGRHPPDLPVFSFGKAVDQNRPLTDFAKEDIAHSLVSCFCINIIQGMGAGCRAYGISNLYFGGNFFRHELMRKEIAKSLSRLVGGFGLKNIRYLVTGHTGAIGALVTNHSEFKNFLVRSKPAAEDSKDLVQEAAE